MIHIWKEVMSKDDLCLALFEFMQINVETFQIIASGKERVTYWKRTAWEDRIVGRSDVEGGLRCRPTIRPSLHPPLLRPRHQRFVDTIFHEGYMK